MTDHGNAQATSLSGDDPECPRTKPLVACGEIKLAALDNTADWFLLTEITNSLLNELIAYTSRERRRQMKQVEPDLCRVKLLEELFEEVHGINSDPENFKSLGRMKAIIDRYGPKLAAVTDA
ncbi:hypothetical protein ACWKW6_12320 [Dyadobacter jiangsuensis]